LKDNLELLNAICQREDVSNLPIHQQAILFASISRFIAHQPSDSPTNITYIKQMEQAFAKFKSQFGSALAGTKELDISDVIALV